MTLLAIILVLAYLVAICDGATRFGRFLKGVERDAKKTMKKGGLDSH